MKKTGKRQMLKGLVLTFVLTFGIFVWSSESVISLAASTAKVVASSGMIRANADKNSDVVGSVKKGDSLEVISSSNDGAGYTWYKVYVDSQKTGYIRGDLVTVDGNVSAETASASEGNGSVTVVGSNKTTTTVGSGNSQTTTTVGSGNSQTTTTVGSGQSQTSASEESNVGTTDVLTAKATTDVRVRKGAGTNFDVAGQAKGGTEVNVSGIATDSEGKNWYQVSFQSEGKNVNGFIREDFLEVLSRVEVPVEEPVEEPVVEEAPVVDNQDYQLMYTQNDTGVMDWYLIDNVNGTSQSLTQILNAIEQIKENELAEDEQVSTMRIIIIVMAVILVALIVAVTILIFKLRDSYEYEYEDDDDEDDDDEDDDEDEGDDEDDDKASRKPRFGFMKKKEEVEEDFDEDDEDDDLEEIQPEKPAKSKKTEGKAWQSKDFLELDDDMEFEFLDL
ncbi:MAG: SH3 domain-containing protein [Lachnospiraceae bacterium]|nr:SH3 domain-containing protein [Lachnospiraceae bacterium]